MQLGERAGFGAPLARLAGLYNRWFVDRPRRAMDEADPLSVFDRDPDDGPENEGLMRYIP
jgi:hypothetical protein